jgi:two-component system, chemotaxis family, protein-glutamate methylesterase/glutaminase
LELGVAIQPDIIVIGASAGAVGPLSVLISELPPLPLAAVFIVMHSGPNNPERLRDFLQLKCSISVSCPDDNDPIVLGRIYVARHGRHLCLEQDRIRLTDAPKEHYARPAIDVLFRSAAKAFGSRVIGIVLSGILNDGTSGMQAIKQRGGIALVQSPEEAEWPSMPRSAIENVAVDRVLRIAEMRDEIVRLIH